LKDKGIFYALKIARSVGVCVKRVSKTRAAVVIVVEGSPILALSSTCYILIETSKAMDSGGAINIDFFFLVFKFLMSQTVFSIHQKGSARAEKLGGHIDKRQPAHNTILKAEIISGIT
jgi:hypothetical protein